MNVYATITRNAMPKLAGNIYGVLHRMMREDDHLVIIENDSVDLSKAFLGDIKRLYDNVHLISDDWNAPQFHPGISRERAQHLANCRNQYMDYIRDNLDPEYLVVFDSDLCVLATQNFYKMFTQHEAVSSNGLDVARQPNKERTNWDIHACYYDTWAYQRMDGTIFKPQEIQPAFNNQGLIEVMSGFGGLAVYRWDFIKDLRYRPYSWNNDNAALCEHGGLHEEIRNAGGRVFINTEYCPVRTMIPF